MERRPLLVAPLQVGIQDKDCNTEACEDGDAEPLVDEAEANFGDEDDVGEAVPAAATLSDTALL